MTTADRAHDLKLRLMGPWHLPCVAEIMAEAFDPRWQTDKVASLLQRPNRSGCVAILGKEIVGFAIYTESKQSRMRSVYDLDFFAIAKHRRREGLGRLFFRMLCGDQTVELRCRSQNTAGHEFWRSLGFKAKKIERGYYRDPTDDAIAMRYKPNTEASDQ